MPSTMRYRTSIKGEYTVGAVNPKVKKLSSTGIALVTAKRVK